jgi:ATP-dependent helicase/nuclease subunit A
MNIINVAIANSDFHVVNILKSLKIIYKMSKLFEAGAGTGKTTKLCNTFLQLFFSSNSEPSDFYIISFTEKAVSEIKERLLENALKLYPYKNSPLLISAAECVKNNKELENVISKLNKKDLEKKIETFYLNFEEIHINTIHSFCSHFLRRYFLELNLQPDFKVCDTSQYNTKNKEIYNFIIASLLENTSYKKLFSSLFTYIEPQKLNNILTKLYERNIILSNTTQSFHEQINNIYLPHHNNSYFPNIILFLIKEINKEEYTQMLLKNGYITFNQILYLFYILLQRSEKVREDIKNKVKFLLVDEIQDVDPIQYKIIWELVNENSKLIENKVYLFGDKNQSIYSFRDADTKSFNTFSKIFVQPLKLNTNYRSYPPIVYFTNHLGKFLFGEEYLQLTPFRTDSFAKENNIQLYFMDILTNCANEKEAEAIFITKKIHHLKYDYPGLEFRDIAILLQTTTHLDILCEQLTRHKIPYIIYGGSQFFKKPEIVAFINFLKAIYMPYDKITLLSLLRDIFTFFNDEQVKITFQANSVEEILSRIKKAAKADIKNLRNAILKSNIVDIILNVMQKRGYIGKYLNPAHYNNAYANLTKIIEIIFSQEDEILFSDLVEFLQKSSQEKEQEAIVYDETIDAVKIMTVHKAKGLEFKVVILPFLNSTISHKQEDFQIKFLLGNKIDDELQTVIKYQKNYLDISSKNYFESLEKENEEIKRLFYVATTRAKDILILTSFITNSSKISKDSFLFHLVRYLSKSLNIEDQPITIKQYRFLIDYLKNTEKILKINGEFQIYSEIIQPENINSSDNIPKETLLSNTAEVSFSKNKNIWKEREKTYKKNINLGLFCYPSLLLRKNIENIETTNDDPEVKSKVTQSVLVGQLVHECLKEIDFRSQDINGIVKKIETKYALNFTIVKKVSSILELAKSRGLFEKLRKYEVLYRELPFMYKKDKSVYITGYIDILLKDKNTIYVCDYKTDRIKNQQEVKVKVKQYKKQLKYYKEAVLNLGVKRRTKIVPALIFVRLGEIIPL